MTRILGYVAADVGELEPAYLCEQLAGLGYTGVDWTMEQFDPLEAPAGELVELVRVAVAAGLSVPQLMVHQDYVTPDRELWEQRVLRTERALEAAAAAGVPTIGIVTGPNRWVDGWAQVGRDLDDVAAWDCALRALERALARAAATGVGICLEPCWGTLAWSRATADELLERVGDERLWLTVDPSHFAISGDDVAAATRAWAARVRHVHLKDAFGMPGVEGEDFCFLLPGEGRTNWGAFFEALDEIGYAGAMSVEFESFRLRAQVFGGDVVAGAALAHGLASGLLASRGSHSVAVHASR